MASKFFAILLISLAVITFGNVSVSAQGWSQFGGVEADWQSNLDVDPAQIQFSKAWSIELKATDDSKLVGKSGIVVDKNVGFVHAGGKSKTTGKYLESLIAIDLDSGASVWSAEDSLRDLKEQESFSGDPRAPQATPAITEGKIISLGFTGLLNCRDIGTGEIVWSVDLVESEMAEAVQFGFSASPIVRDDFLYVQAPGENGGLFCLDLRSGEVIWVNKMTGPAYATPVLAEFGNEVQWVVVADSEVRGVRVKDGTTLWSHPFAEQGLTNVPTPLVVNRSRLVISGQGCLGTRGLQIEKQGENWSVEEVWYNRNLQFFYSNWMVLNGFENLIAIGCTDKYMAAFDCDTGKTLGRWRGFGDGNIIKTTAGLLIVNGWGKLSSLSIDNSQLNELKRFRPLTTRVWTPATVSTDKLLIRSGDQVLCLNASQNAEDQGLENDLEESKPLKFKVD